MSGYIGPTSTVSHEKNKQLIYPRLQVVLPELASIIVSALVMNVFDTIAIFNVRDIITNDIEKMVYGYLKDEIEALSWFHVNVDDHDEILKVSSIPNYNNYFDYSHWSKNTKPS